MASCLSDNMLSSLIEGCLSADELAAVESHIDTCDRCRKLAGALAASHLHSNSQVVNVVTIGDLAAPIPWQPPDQVDEYRILHLIGQGQMGQVYKAHDLELDRYVALKLLRASEPDAASRDRFRVEARAIARLRHPGVVGIYRTGDIDGHPYIVSEFVTGRSLDRLEKPIPVGQVLHIGIGIARGLAAAHHAGVLHRDVKPANVMLGDDGEIKLLDFGLAKLASSLSSVESSGLKEQALADPLASLTRSGSWVGTPRYMAPEVWRSEPATEHSDLYSLGSMLYELCAGRPPHPQTDLSELRRSATERDPEPLSTVVPLADTRLASLIMCCLERDPAQRPADARTLCTALEQIQAEAPTRVRRLWRPGIKLAVALGIGAAITGLVWNRGSWRTAVLSSSPIDQPGKIKLRRSIAILGFQNVGGKSETAWISTALTEMLRTELAAGGALRLIPGENVSQMQRDLLLPETSSLGKESLSKIRTYLGVDLVLLGAYTMRGATMESGLRLELRLQDTAMGDTLEEGSETASDGNLLPLVTRASDRLRGFLAIPRPDAKELAPVRYALPESPEAVRAYAEGLMALRKLDLAKARDRLELAAKTSLKNPMVYKALAESYAGLGYTEKQREAAKRAWELSGNLTREDQLATEAFYYESVGKFTAAAKIYEHLFAVFSDNFEHGYNLANAQGQAGMPRESLSTIAQLVSKFPSPMNDDPRLDIVSEWAYRKIGDFSSAMRVSNLAAEKAKARGAMHLFAKLQVSKGWALYGIAEYESAETLLDSTIATLEPLNYPNEYTWACFGSALSKQRMGRIAEATKIFEHQIDFLRKSGSSANLVSALNYCSIAILEQGHPTAAGRYSEEALQISKDYNLESGLNSSYLQLGQVNLYLGKWKEAVNFSAKATALCNPEDKKCLGLAMLREGRALHMSGDIEKTRNRLETTLSLFEGSNEIRWAAVTRLALAESMLDNGEYSASMQLSELAAESFHKQKAENAEWHSRAVWSQALLAQGRTNEAEQLISPIRVSAAKSENAQTRLRVALAAATIHAAVATQTDLEAARQELATARDEVDRLGCVPESFEINLALADVMQRLGKRDVARKLLASLLNEARAVGFGLYEKKARGLLLH